MAVLAYTWADQDAVPGGAMQLRVVPILDDIDCFVDNNDLEAGPAVGADFTPLLGGKIPDTCARCLSVTYFVANSGSARGVTVRIRGIDQFGANVEEFITFAAKAANTTNITYTRHAYTHLASVTLCEQTGTVGTNDRLDVGLAWTSGVAAGTHDATNGSAATDYKTVGIPCAVSATDGFGAVDQLDFPVQVRGVIYAEDATSGVTTRTAIGVGGDFGIDTTYQTIRLDEEFVLSGAGNHEALLYFIPNRRKSQGWGGITVTSVAPAPDLGV